MPSHSYTSKDTADKEKNGVALYKLTPFPRLWG